jgi:hypothetical protein
MFDVCCYQCTSKKTEIFKSFFTGAERCNATVYTQGDFDLVDCRLAFILGWHIDGSRKKHITFRKRIKKHQDTNRNRIMSVDANCFGVSSKSKNNQYLRYSLDSVYYDEGFYNNKNSNTKKWEIISKDLGIQIKDWRKNGEHILICAQKKKGSGWSAKNSDQDKWLVDTVDELVSVTDRPIVVRPHPGVKRSYEVCSGLLKDKENVVISNSKDKSMQEDLKNAWAAVFFNSSSCVSSALEGIPTFVTEKSAVAWDVANHSIKNINNPTTPDRMQWLYDLAACHWSYEESRNGDIYKAFEPYL